ncbi:hypothetical protein ACHWQZ_G004354 [Mnemiopsis leidyi]
MADDRVRKQLAHCYNSIEYLHGSQEYWTGDRAIKFEINFISFVSIYLILRSYTRPFTLSHDTRDYYEIIYTPGTKDAEEEAIRMMKEAGTKEDALEIIRKIVKRIEEH